MTSNLNDALTYIYQVRNSVSPETYTQFLAAMRKYQFEGQPIKEVHYQIKELFVHMPCLIEGFEKFLPVECDKEAGVAEQCEEQAKVKAKIELAEKSKL